MRCYPAKVPDLIKNCCDYLEKNGRNKKILKFRKKNEWILGLQTIGLFRVGVSKKRLREVWI